eukprot:2135367-Pyramimonas_sp.AAC.1
MADPDGVRKPQEDLQSTPRNMPIDMDSRGNVRERIEVGDASDDATCPTRTGTERGVGGEAGVRVVEEVPKLRSGAVRLLQRNKRARSP